MAELRNCDGELVLMLPAEVRTKLGWESGDIMQVEIEGDGIRVVRTQTSFDHAMEIARHGMEEYRETLAALAKS